VSEDSNEDWEVWLDYREGDTKAFTTIFRRHAPAVFRYSWAILRSTDAAEEAVQETFLTAWDKRTSIVLIGGSMLPWLLSCAKNHSRNIARRASKHLRVAKTLEVEAASTGSQDASDAIAAIEQEIAKLPIVDQKICQLCLVSGFSYSEASRILDLTESTVGKRLQRARARLKSAAAWNE